MDMMNLVQLGWDIGTFLQKAKEAMIKWGGYLIMLIGVILIIVAVYQLAKKFIAPQSAGPGGWATPIMMLIIGGALAVGGWQFIYNIAQGGKKTIEDLGTGGTYIVPFVKNSVSNLGVGGFIKSLF